MNKFLFQIIALLFSVLCCSCINFQKEESPVAIEYLSKYSLDSLRIAAVYYKQGQYFLSVKQDSLSLLDSLICKKGYHDALMTLTWKSNDSLKITYDVDFGDNVQTRTFGFSSAFDHTRSFKVVNYSKVIDEQIKDVDTLSCNQWKLNSLDIEKVIKESKPISGYEWHHLYGHFTCEYEGKLLQGSQ